MQPGFAHSSGCASNSLASLGAPKKEVYFMAIIDILTPYDAKKKAAHAAKTVKHGVSSLPPAGRMGSGASALPACLCVCVMPFDTDFLSVWESCGDPLSKNCCSFTVSSACLGKFSLWLVDSKTRGSLFLPGAEQIIIMPLVCLTLRSLICS